MLPAYREYLEPGPRHEISGLLTCLRAVYFVPDMPDSLGEAVANVWTDDLSGFPLWAVKAACDFYRRTEPRKVPTPASIIALAKEEIERERREMREIELALNARPDVPETSVPRRNRWEDIAKIALRNGG